MVRLVPLLVLVACERTVSSDADCVAWVDSCAGCAQQCTPAWLVSDELCRTDCGDPVLAACVADGDRCVFRD